MGKAISPEDMTTLRSQEQAVAQDYYSKGIFRQIWTIKGGAVVICEADSREQIEGHVAALPMVERGCLEVTLENLDPYRGFGANSGAPRKG